MRVPSETNLKNLTRSRLKGRNDGYFRPTNFKFHYVAPQFFIFRRTVQIAPNFRHWNAHIFFFWLNPTRHSKFHNTPKHRFRFVFARTHTHTHTQSYVCGALKWGHLKRKHLTGQLLDRMHQPFIFSERKKWRILHLLLRRLLFLRGTFNAFHLRL